VLRFIWFGYMYNDCKFPDFWEVRHLSIELYMWVSNVKVLRDRFFRILFVMRSFPGALPEGNFSIIY